MVVTYLLFFLSQTQLERLKCCLCLLDQTPAHWTQLPGRQTETCQQVSRKSVLPCVSLSCSHTPSYCENTLIDAMISCNQRWLRWVWSLHRWNTSSTCSLSALVLAQPFRRPTWWALKTAVMETVSRETATMTPPTVAILLVRADFGVTMPGVPALFVKWFYLKSWINGSLAPSLVWLISMWSLWCVSTSRLLSASVPAALQQSESWETESCLLISVKYVWPFYLRAVGLWNVWVYIPLYFSVD